MIAIIMIISIIAQVSQQVCRKEFNKISEDIPFGFSLAGVLATLIYFLITAKGNVNVSPKIFSYVIPFSICYTTAYVCTIFAIKHGPLSLTSLIISCSVAVPLIYGVVVLREPLNMALILGIVFLFSSIILVSKPWEKGNSSITPKWIMYISLTFLSNGICMTTQKLFQIKDKGFHSNEFMIFSLVIVFFIILIFVLTSERKKFKDIITNGHILWPALCGTSNGIANQLTMILAVSLPASFLYPVQSAGAIILTAFVSILVYKEKLSNLQKVGFLFGIFAIIIFNI